MARALAVELAVAAGLAAIALGWPAAIGLWVAAATLAGGGLVRWRRRWLGTWALIWLGFVRRRAGRKAASRARPDPVSCELLPIDHTGAVALVIGDSVVTAVAVESEGRLRRIDHAMPLDIGPLADAVLRLGDVELAEVRVVQAVRPAPAGQQTPPARSYLLLQGSRVPAAVDTYITVRLDRAASPVAVASRGGGALGAARALRQPLHRLLSALPRPGLTLRPVTDPAELLAASGGAGSEPGGSEDWRNARAGGRVHISFELVRWPQRWSTDGRERVAALLGGLPCVLAAHSTSIRRAGAALTCRDVLRVTAGSTRQAEDAAHALLARGGAAGLILRRLDGEQWPALPASVPTSPVDFARRLRPHRVHPTRPDGLLIPPGRGGLLLGVDEAGSALAARLFGPAPFSACLVGDVWAASVLAFRAVAVGAHVVIETGRPGAWGRLRHAAGGAVGLAAGKVAPTAETPQLHIYDLGAAPPPPPPASAWQTRLTLLPYLHADASDVVARAPLLGLGRLTPEELALLQNLGELPDDAISALPSLGDDEVYWADANGFVRSLLRPTSVECALLSPPGQRLRAFAELPSARLRRSSPRHGQEVRCPRFGR